MILNRIDTVEDFGDDKLMMRVSVRLDDYTYRKLMKIANNSSKSHAIRYLIKNTPIKNIQSVNPNNKIYTKICQLENPLSHFNLVLTRDGDNLNQIAKKLNQRKNIPIYILLSQIKSTYHAVNGNSKAVVNNQHKIITMLRKIKQ